MALRARLAAQLGGKPESLPALAPKWTALSSHLFWKGDRRLEAENYLSTGYGLRLSMEERAAGWQRLGQMAEVRQPPRIKATLVSREFGAPFLVANQMFSIRPHVRKWLSVEHLPNPDELYVSQGTILVRRSADVGRSVLTCAHHEGHLISDHFFRLDPIQGKNKGWLYAFLRSPQARAMMTGAKYGHIINHIEIAHLKALPVPVVRDEVAAEFQKRTDEILSLRNRAYSLSLEAEAKFESALGPLRIQDWGEGGFEIRARSLFQSRRRLEAIPHNPGVATIRKHLEKNGSGFARLCDSGFEVWLPGRFRRVRAESGVRFLDSADLFETNPDSEKFIADLDFGDAHRGRVKAGWLLLARSGQTYGINGSVMLATEALEDSIVSDHVIRVAPAERPTMRVGYLCVALSHPHLGRPLVKSLAYGSSIPEIDPTDFSNFEVVRLSKNAENAIADLAEESAAERAKADLLERELASDAGKLIERFLAGDTAPFVATMPSSTS